MRRFLFWVGLVVLFAVSGRPCPGQPPATAVDLSVSPAESPSPGDSLRLLPTAPELKDGNAAVVMLRMIWEQQPFMQTVLPKYQELQDLRYDDPRIAAELRFDAFERQLRRAAYMASADWQYPLQEDRFAYIVLPDLQGLRSFAGRGLAMWTGSRLAERDFAKSRQGILVQIACARHLARTPIAVNRLMAEAVAAQGLTSVERWIGVDKSPNLYWGLARLPDELGDTSAMLQWEAESLKRSLPALGRDLPEDRDPRWKQAFAELTEILIDTSSSRPSPAEAQKMQDTAFQLARADLAKRAGYSAERIGQLSPEAAIVQWCLAVHAKVSSECEAAFSHPPHIAITRLAAAEGHVREIVRQTGVSVTPFPENGVGLYLATRRFDRKVKVLQTIEAIRDYVTLRGQLPASLDELRLPAPLDPLTNQPFAYQVEGPSATLRTPTVEGITDAQQTAIISSYRITLKP